MFVRCPDCGKHYNDAFRWTICPHRPLSEVARTPEEKGAAETPPQQVPVYKIDAVNWVKRPVNTPHGPVLLEGMTVRALRQLLEKCDNDDLVTYMAEVTPEVRNAELLFGVIGGVGVGGKGVTCLIGPEVARELKKQSVPQVECHHCHEMTPSGSHCAKCGIQIKPGY